MTRWLGVLSGTSMDAATAVLCDPEPPGRVFAKADVPWPSALRGRVLEFQAAMPTPERRDPGLERDVGLLLAAAAEGALARGEADGVGLHGQTVAHSPEDGWTMQVGDPALVAQRTGLPTWSAFRDGDLGRGGQGAPLAPLYDSACQGTAATLWVNLGGLLNATWIPREGAPVASDVTVCNHLLDSLWAARGGSGPYDSDGKETSQGRAADHRGLAVAAHPFHSAAPPKSTHTEVWAEEVAATASSLAELARRDAMATVARAVASSLRDWVDRWVGEEPERVSLSGGGARNAGLERWVRYLFPESVVAVDPLVDAREGVLFAWLAREAAAGTVHDTAPFTGAAGPVSLGRLWEP